MPTYHVTVQVAWTQAIEADNVTSAKALAKDSFKDQYDLRITDEEIEVEEQ